LRWAASGRISGESKRQDDHDDAGGANCWEGAGLPTQVGGNIGAPLISLVDSVA